MKSNKEKLKEINEVIKILEKALKNAPQDKFCPSEAIEWGEKQIEKAKKKRDKLMLLM